jgi:hypothetical protein
MGKTISLMQQGIKTTKKTIIEVAIIAQILIVRLKVKR